MLTMSDEKTNLNNPAEHRENMYSFYAVLLFDLSRLQLMYFETKYAWQTVFIRF